MIKDQIDSIQAKLRNAEHVPAGIKEELVQLLAELEREVSLLSETHEAEAQKIAASTHQSAEHLTQSEKTPELVEAALHDLRESVVGFENSHPNMTGVVGRLATTLSNMGI